MKCAPDDLTAVQKSVAETMSLCLEMRKSWLSQTVLLLFLFLMEPWTWISHPGTGGNTIP